MDIGETLSELTSLPVTDRLRVVESLWDSIESDTPVSLSPEQRDEINRRIEAHEANPGGLWRLMCTTRGKLAPNETITLVNAAGRDDIELSLGTKQPDGTWIARPQTATPATIEP